MASRKNLFQPLIDQVPKPLRNRYYLVLFIFLVWMLFFDKHDVFTQLSLHQTLNKLEDDKEFYVEKIEDVKQDKANLQKDTEKYARERYYMSKKNEDVFIIEKK